MNSIQEQSPEEHIKNLSGSEGATKIKELADQVKMCFFVTKVGNQGSEGIRPMGIARADEDGTLYFISANDSDKNQEITRDPFIKLYIHGHADAAFLYLEGTGTIIADKAIIEELWTPFMKVWFTEGKDDPRISAIRFVPVGGHYWDTKHGKAGFVFKSILSLLSGTTMDDGIEGTITK